ncbi:MAG: aldehyde dehydrogenase (NADP(+)) [Saprospiraceae bacterium]|nr:aldehyde dehydrogenase (NADP(+)) [Saprospiraceae bacterium]
MNISGKQLIGNQQSNRGEVVFFAFNPKTNEPLETTAFYEATDDEIAEAVELAERAFDVYRQKTDIERAIFLETIADEILNLGDVLIQTAMSETALPEPRLIGERGRTMGQLRLFAQLLRGGEWVNARIDRAQPDRQPLPKSDIRQMQMPLGVVAVFGASNFPLAFSTAGGDTVSALAAGCPVVFKAHPAHPSTCELVGQAILNAAEKTGMPNGVFSLLQGASNRVGQSLVMHPSVKAVGFTGSYRGGKAIFDLANSRPEPIPVYAEMGSTNPVFFLPRILKEKKAALAAGLAQSVTLGGGQFCTNPGVFVLQNNEDTEGVLAAIADNLSQLPAATLLTQGIKKAYVQGIVQQRETVGTAALTAFEGDFAQPHLLKTSVETTLQNPEILEEVFGPSTVGVVANDKEQILTFAKNLKGHLTATIHGTEEDLAEYSELIQILTTKVGRLVFNGFPTGVEVTAAMVHGGPFPATTVPLSTSVGTTAIYRFTRPVCFQDFPQSCLPDALKDSNPLGIGRWIDGVFGK